MTTFEQFPIPAELKNNLMRNGFEKPTPVQAQAIPQALNGRDLLVSSQTGSGKTIAFLVPLVAKMLESHQTRGIVLVPTRELALQVISVYRKITNNQSHMLGVSLVGGMPMGAQFRELSKNPRMIVATPGRLLDHCRRKPQLLRNFNFTVVDEADRMLDMGFLPQLKDVLKYVSPERQNLLFSATFPQSVKNLTRELLRNPFEISIEKTKETAPQITQKMQELAHEQKNDAVLDHLRNNQGTMLIFARTQMRAERLAKFLKAAGVNAGVIHGGRTQAQRNFSLQEFRTGKSRALVATDVASRGIDVPHVAHVLNYDLPANAEDYVHRIGRTGRAGRTGEATSFVTRADYGIWNQIARATGQANGTGGSRSRDRGPSQGRPHGRPHRHSRGRPEGYSQNRPESQEGRSSHAPRRPEHKNRNFKRRDEDFEMDSRPNKNAKAPFGLQRDNLQGKSKKPKRAHGFKPFGSPTRRLGHKSNRPAMQADW